MQLQTGHADPHRAAAGGMNGCCKETKNVGQDINVLALVKGQERYVFLYDDESRAETLRMLGRYASNPELSFTWYDAAVLSQKVRQEARKLTLRSRFELPLTAESDEM
jgi:hypothetical protein